MISAESARLELASCAVPCITHVALFAAATILVEALQRSCEWETFSARGVGGVDMANEMIDLQQLLLNDI